MNKKTIITISLIITGIFFLNAAGADSSKNKQKSKAVKTFVKPLSFGLYKGLIYPVTIYIPQSNYHQDYAGLIGLGFTAEYRFTQIFAMETGLLFHGGFQYMMTKYILEENDELHQIEMLNVNLFMHFLISAKFYFPKNPIKEKAKMMIRLGIGYDIFLMSYYNFYDNKTLVSSGNMIANQLTGPDVYGDYHNYSSIYNTGNITLHFGIGPKIISKKNKLCIIPELRYTYFLLPVRDGRKAGIDGLNAFMVRNDGTDKSLLFDIKMNAEFSLTLQFGMGAENDNLLTLLADRKKSKDKNKNKKQETDKKKKKL